jgi:RNA-directed DNA polymerase
MKRHGNLFHQYAHPDALLQAYRRAREEKRNSRGCFLFERNLGANIHGLHAQLLDATYAPLPVNAFRINDGRKPRLIEAPSFRDLVVQHAVYAVVGPLFDRRYIATNFACRTGLGMHAAADWLQAAMRRAPRNAWTLHVDVRKFFYTVDRATLAALVRRIIKCPDTLRLLDLFAQRPAPTGIPIGNLMSQTFANLYLNSLDHFCKRSLGATDYARYMDDAVMIAPSRAVGQDWLHRIGKHLALLGLEISHHSLQPIARGVNWVGYRTWARARFVRPHLVHQIRADARAQRLQPLVSRLGHARRTASHRPLIQYITEHHHAVAHRLPQSLHAHAHVGASAARGQRRPAPGPGARNAA